MKNNFFSFLKINKKITRGFTLVELVVVITILAILGTIWLISFNSYNSSTRDATRASNINNIVTALEINKVKTNIYPEPTRPFSIKDNWFEVFVQWTFWDLTRKIISWLSDIPKDPLYWIEYSYSVNQDRTEYQIAWVYESDQITYNLLSLNKAMAVSIDDPEPEQKKINVFVKWNYNWVMTKSMSWWVTKLYGLPTIMSSDIENNWVPRSIYDLIDTEYGKTLVLNKAYNIPASYKNTKIANDYFWKTPFWKSYLEVDYIVVWTGSTSPKTKTDFRCMGIKLFNLYVKYFDKDNPIYQRVNLIQSNYSEEDGWPSDWQENENDAKILIDFWREIYCNNKNCPALNINESNTWSSCYSLNG